MGIVSLSQEEAQRRSARQLPLCRQVLAELFIRGLAP